MVGMKRPYPFSPDFPPVPAFQCKFPPGYVNLSSRSPESASCSNECAASLESGNLLKRFDVMSDHFIVLVLNMRAQTFFLAFFLQRSSFRIMDSVRVQTKECCQTKESSQWRFSHVGSSYSCFSISAFI